MPETTAQWVIYVALEDDADYEAADKWHDVITEAVYRHDPHFSGIVGMKKETADAEV